MTEQLPVLPKIVTTQLSRLAKVAFAATLILNICINSSLAADPFRAKEPRNIGDKTEAAFKAIFEQGNYQAAENQVQEALTKEADEPLAYAMKASLAYTNQDWNALETYSKKTLEVAQKLVSSDPLRGNLYSAVGHFLEGAVILQREGTLSGAPKALSRLREVYKFLDLAEAVSATDPELNLVKGYMDLMLAVNLPFSNPEQAIEKFEKNAAPQYLVDRGIALAYRDMKQYSQALDYTNRALKVTSDNPELYYLKAQILREQGKKDKNTKLIQEAVDHFDKALSKKGFLPASVVKQIERERGKAVKEIASASR
ncbi:MULTISPECIES: Sll0314/Alr1548 family TPR repeat-containing protein [Nostocales]|uniref:Tetratricopeptide TPR_2 n=3 Tax=Nostocales TaxID=1161 RepID=A0A0C1QSJ8_9CYAN|nr:Sll0314/Alr1548 family TPR repeat-containing protein [Tolypothrix bouteillei]KAF3883731.1 tetratricopeptide repeat protein [Tolypothrix bouteillei VB521301]